MKRFSVNHDRITASFDDGSLWELPISDLVLVGEYTTEDGPGSEDHFICVVDRNGNRYDVSDEAGSGELIRALSATLGISLKPRLSLKTQFESCILYPPSVAGQPLFTQPKPARSLVERVKGLLVGVSHRLDLSPTAEQLLSVS
jgi:hypothetical protein